MAQRPQRCRGRRNVRLPAGTTSVDSLRPRLSRSPAAADGPDLPAEVVLQRLEQADTDDSRAVAARRWDLDALAARYRLVLAQTQVLTAQAGQHAPGAAADDPDLRPADR